MAEITSLNITMSWNDNLNCAKTTVETKFGISEICVAIWKQSIRVTNWASCTVFGNKFKWTQLTTCHVVQQTHRY